SMGSLSIGAAWRSSRTFRAAAGPSSYRKGGFELASASSWAAGSRMTTGICAAMGVLLSGDITLRKRYTSSLTGPLLGSVSPTCSGSRRMPASRFVFSSHQLELVERLCDRVGIIRSGEMVACGPVDQLRQTGGERLWVDAPQAPDGWWAACQV